MDRGAVQRRTRFDREFYTVALYGRRDEDDLLISSTNDQKHILQTRTKEN